jgi:hypothetical protein
MLLSHHMPNKLSCNHLGAIFMTATDQSGEENMHHSGTLHTAFSTSCLCCKFLVVVTVPARSASSQTSALACTPTTGITDAFESWCRLAVPAVTYTNKTEALCHGVLR